MQPFRQLNGVAVALRRDNVDTDQVIPARFLKISRAEGLGDALFRDLRFDADGKPRPDFPLNDPARKGASILIGRKNFGVGSSREAAVYALVDHGFRCVVATSFGDIFAGNSVNNGLVAAIVSEEDIEKLLSAVEQTGRPRSISKRRPSSPAITSCRSRSIRRARRGSSTAGTSSI